MPYHVKLSQAVAVVSPVDSACTVTARLLVVPVKQPLLGVTVTLPDVDPQSTVIEVVPCPDAIVAPVGTVHVYVVALVTAVVE